MGLKPLNISPPEEMVQPTVKTGVTLLYLSFVHAKSLVFRKGVSLINAILQ
jgi:hypothetical protein